MVNNKSVAFYVLILVCHLASVSASNISQVISCPGDVLTTECAITGGGITVWQGTALQCDCRILLRHSRFGELRSPTVSCNNGAIAARGLGVVNGSYISQLNVTVSPELNNTTVECWYSNRTFTVIKQIQIIVLATGKQKEVQSCHYTCVDIKVKGHACAYYVKCI